MEKRERVLRALDLEKPDVIPTHALHIDGNNIDKILGVPSTNFFDVINKVREDNKENWLEEANNLVSAGESYTFLKAAQAAAKIGLDSIQMALAPLKFIEELDPTGFPLMMDYFGRVWQIRDNSGCFNPYYVQGRMNTEQQWLDFKDEIYSSLMKQYGKKAYRLYKRINKHHKDDIFTLGSNMFFSLFESTWEGMGIEFFSKQLIKNPGFIAKVFDTYADFTIELFNSFIDAGSDLVVVADDLAYKTRPIMSIRKYYDLLLPAYKKITSAVHDKGGKVAIHSCGYVIPLLDFIVESGFDGLQSLEPTAGVDLKLVKKKVGDKICLLGNIDVSHVLVRGSKQDVEKAVNQAIKNGGPEGFIVSPANMHYGVNPENLRWMVEAARGFNE